MKKTNIRLSMILAFLSIVLILSYTLISLIPHGHECLRTDCAICAVICVSRGLLAGGAMLAALFWAAQAAMLAVCTDARPLSNREYTLVGLKVKLSN